MTQNAKNANTMESSHNGIAQQFIILFSSLNNEWLIFFFLFSLWEKIS